MVRSLLWLLAGRADLFCTADVAIADLKRLPEFRHTRPAKMLLPGETTPLYPYLHRRHAELAPRKAAGLRQMQAEGLMERHRLEAARVPSD